MLVALRLWSSHWRNRRVTLTVRSHNVATLAMVAKMQPHSQQLGIIAREIALDVASATYAPDVAVHLPGLANSHGHRSATTEGSRPRRRDEREKINLR